MKKLNLRLLITSAMIILSAIIFTNSCKKVTSVDVPVTPVTPVNVPAVTSLSVNSALPNSAISINGTNFNAAAANNSVTINGVPATVNSASATEIVFTIPAAATSGKLLLVTGGTTVTAASTFTVLSGTQATFATANFEHVAVDASGNIYGDGRDKYQAVLKASSAGTVSVLAGNTPATTNPFKSLWGTAVDASGNVLVAAGNNCQILKVSPAGSVSVFAGSGVREVVDGTGTSAGFYAPVGLAIDAAGNLYTNDNLRVRKITPAGVVTTLAGTGVAGNVDGPGITAQFGRLEGIAVDAAGNVYVDDMKNLTLRKITPAGVVSTLAGSGTAGFADGQGTAAQFNYPQGMAIDAAGNIFIADNQFNNGIVFTIRMVNKIGLVTTFMKNTYPGSSWPSTMTNGVIGVASTNFPDGIAFDSAGSMYICNTGVPLVSKITFK